MKSFCVSIISSLLVWTAAQTNETNQTDVEITPTGSPTFEKKQWGGCQMKFSGATVETLEKMEIGKKTIICFHIGNSKNWAAGVDYIRLSFRPLADEYSRLHVPNSFEDLVASPDSIFVGRDITIAPAAQAKSGFLRQYYDQVTTNVYPYLTAIVDVDQGWVRGVTWDDSCVFCGPDQCNEITYGFNGDAQTQASSGQPTKGCAILEDECNVLLADGDKTCDLTVYVVWTGTDANGVAFQSSAMRFSRFPPQDLGDRVSNSLPQINAPHFGGGGQEARVLYPDNMRPAKADVGL